MADQAMVCAEQVWKSFGKLDVLKGIDLCSRTARHSRT
jgi:hypothetical protein